MNSILRAGLLLALAGNASVSYAQGAPATTAAAGGVTTGVKPSLTTEIPANAPFGGPSPEAVKAAEKLKAPAPKMTDSAAPASAAPASQATAPPQAAPAAPPAAIPLTEAQIAAIKPDYELFQAAYAGQTWRVRQLLDKGAHINAADWQYGFTPLMWAAKKGNLGTVRLLISRGANVNARSTVGVPLIFDSKVPTRDIFGGQLNMEQDLSHSLLLSLRGGVTALHIAAASGWGMTARELLARGANVNAIDADGATALFAAAYLNDVPTIKAMLARGAKMDIVNFIGRDALWLATVHGSDNAVRELLERGAKPVADMRGEWPSDMARVLRFASTVALLARPERLAKAALAARNTDSAESPAHSVPTPDPAMTNPALKGNGGIIILN